MSHHHVSNVYIILFFLFITQIEDVFLLHALELISPGFILQIFYIPRKIINYPNNNNIHPNILVREASYVSTPSSC